MENIVSIHVSGISHTAIIIDGKQYFQNAISKVKFHDLETQCRLSEYHDLGFTKRIPEQT